jgi:hypothetical protein
VFQEATIPWKSPVDALILGVGGHLHDGGTAIDIYQNDKRVCEALPTYGTGAGGMSHGDGEHIKSMTSCRLLSPMKAGDTFHLVAKYDMQKHAGGKTDNGELDEVCQTQTLCLPRKRLTAWTDHGRWYRLVHDRAKGMNED